MLHDYICASLKLQAKREQKSQQNERNRSQLHSFFTELWLEDKHIRGVMNISMHISKTRHYFLYTHTFTILVKMLAYQRSYICMFKKSGIFLSSYFIKNKRVRTKSEEEEYQ